MLEKKHGNIIRNNTYFIVKMLSVVCSLINNMAEYRDCTWLIQNE